MVLKADSSIRAVADIKSKIADKLAKQGQLLSNDSN
jgi:hypothetical protein